MRRWIVSGCVLVLFALAAVPVLAATDPGASAWVDKMARWTAEGSYRFGFTGQLAMAQGGMAGTVDFSGDALLADQTRMRMGLVMNMNLAGMTMAVNLTVAGDGTTIWTVVDSPMMGGTQVMKVPVDKMDAFKGAGPLADVGKLADPAGQLRRFVERFDLTVAGVNDGRVTLAADVTGAAEFEGLGGPDNPITRLEIVLDEKTAKPTRFALEGKQPVMTFELTKFERVEPGSLGDAEFAFTPPEGVPVMDLSTMPGGLAAE